MKAASATTFDQYKNMANAVSDSVKACYFRCSGLCPGIA